MKKIVSIVVLLAFACSVEAGAKKRAWIYVEEACPVVIPVQPQAPVVAPRPFSYQEGITPATTAQTVELPSITYSVVAPVTVRTPTSVPAVVQSGGIEFGGCATGNCSTISRPSINSRIMGRGFLRGR